LKRKFLSKKTVKNGKKKGEIIISVYIYREVRGSGNIPTRIMAEQFKATDNIIKRQIVKTGIGNDFLLSKRYTPNKTITNSTTNDNATIPMATGLFSIECSIHIRILSIDRTINSGL